MKSVQAILEVVGRELTSGDDWQSALANLMDIPLDTVNSWLNMTTFLHSDDCDTLVTALEKRRDKLDRAWRAGKAESREWEKVNYALGEFSEWQKCGWESYKECYLDNIVDRYLARESAGVTK